MSNIIEKEWAYAKIYCVDDSESFAEYIDLENPYMTENTLVIDKLEPGKTYIITYYNSNKEVINVNEVKLSMNLKLVYIGRDIVIVNVIHSDVKGVMLKGKTIDYEQQLPVTGIGDQIRFTGLTRDEQYELSPINDSDKLFDTVLIKTNNLELPSAISMDSSEGFISWNVKNSFGLEVKVYQSDGISDTIVKKVDIGKNPQIIEVSKDDPNATYSLVIADNPNWTFEGTSKDEIVSQANIQNFINLKGANLSDPQKNAIETLINEYAQNSIIKENYIDKVSSDPLLFFFEGAVDLDEKYPLASKESTGTSGHANGRYKAIAVLIKNRMIVDVFTDASTLPTNLRGTNASGNPTSTIQEGVYEFNSGLHASRYPALRIRDGGTVPAYSGSLESTGTDYGINIHYAYNTDSYTNPASTGCLTININTEYNDFAHAVGYLSENINIVAGVNESIYIALNGHVVIDRSLRPNFFDEV